MEILEYMLAEINAARSEAGLSPVDMRSDLNCAAKTWAKIAWRAGICGHIGPDQSQFWDRVRDCEGEIRGGSEIVACAVSTSRLQRSA